MLLLSPVKLVELQMLHCCNVLHKILQGSCLEFILVPRGALKCLYPKHK